MSPSFFGLSSVFRRGVIASAMVVACGSTVTLAETVTIVSGLAIPGITDPSVTPQIRALSARSLWSPTSTDATRVNYLSNNASNDTYQFRTVANSSDALFGLAQNAPTASLIGTAGGWNNGTANGTGDNWSGNFATTMNDAHARWIGSPDNNLSGSGDSVLFAIPFQVGSNTLATITLTYATDNQFGSGTNTTDPDTGLPVTPGPAGFVNRGMFLNGSPVLAAFDYTATNGQPAESQWQTLHQITLSGLALKPNSVNWLYLHQFNSDGPGGSAFVANIQMVPLPAPVWGGIAGLAGVGCIAAVRRRRMA